MSVAAPRAARPTQAQRRARTQSALLEAAARGLSRHGYRNLVLEKVARDAGYTRGALYHLFDGKDDLALAVVEWVERSWYAELGHLLREKGAPVTALTALARGHAVFCRRDIARVMMTLRVEFGTRDHPVGAAIEAAERRLVSGCATLIAEARRKGEIAPGPPSPKVTALAYLGALEGLVINLAGRAPFDEELAERAVAGVLGVDERSGSGESR